MCGECKRRARNPFANVDPVTAPRNAAEAVIEQAAQKVLNANRQAYAYREAMERVARCAQREIEKLGELKPERLKQVAPAMEALAGDTPADRLRARRLELGFAPATAACRHFGWNETTYRAHENGQRGLRRTAAVEYAKAYGVSIDWLLTGSKWKH